MLRIKRWWQVYSSIGHYFICNIINTPLLISFVGKYTKLFVFSFVCWSFIYLAFFELLAIVYCSQNILPNPNIFLSCCRASYMSKPEVLLTNSLFIRIGICLHVHEWPNICCPCHTNGKRGQQIPMLSNRTSPSNLNEKSETGQKTCLDSASSQTSCILGKTRLMDQFNS